MTSDSNVIMIGKITVYISLLDCSQKIKESLMKKLLALLILVPLIPTTSQSRPRNVFKIEIGSDYHGYSKKELRQRVWKLERAVYQLQEQVFQLAIDNSHASHGHNKNLWSCHMQSFGKTFTSSGRTKASAIAQILQKCSKATNAVHCHESDASCDNQ